MINNKANLISLTIDRWVSDFTKFELGEKGMHQISVINGGWCYVMAIMVQEKLFKENVDVDIVQSSESSHWFLRYNQTNDDPIYFDAWVSGGSTNLIEIVDRDVDTLVVRNKQWFIDNIEDVLDKYKLFKERGKPMYINFDFRLPFNSGRINLYNYNCISSDKEKRATILKLLNDHLYTLGVSRIIKSIDDITIRGVKACSATGGIRVKTYVNKVTFRSLLKVTKETLNMKLPDRSCKIVDGQGNMYTVIGETVMECITKFLLTNNKVIPINAVIDVKPNLTNIGK